MIFGVLELLRETIGIKIPAVFFYTSTRMILAALTGLLLSIFSGPYFIRKLRAIKIDEINRMVDCPPLALLHAKKNDTPTMGGIIIIFSMLLSLLLWMDLANIFTLILLTATLLLGGVGAYDDYQKLKVKHSKGVSGKKKLLCQVALGAAIAVYLFMPALRDFLHWGNWFAPPIVKEALKQLSINEYASRLYFPFFKEPLVLVGAAGMAFSALFIVFVIAGTSNAVNLTDGLDGLAAGCLIMAASCLGAIAFLSNNIDIANYLNILYIEGSGEIAVYLSSFVGACLGFLWYNGYPAEVFMGDIGSLTLGGILGVCAVLLRRELLLGIIGGIFVVETLSVILQVASFRWRNKKRIFKCTPLHHHFQLSGWPETKVVIRFWIIGLLLAIIGIASLKFQ